jgi:hypothetical protein
MDRTGQVRDLIPAERGNDSRDRGSTDRVQVTRMTPPLEMQDPACHPSIIPQPADTVPASRARGGVVPPYETRAMSDVSKAAAQIVRLRCLGAVDEAG